ncbi:hypothetical protein BTO20_06095 [Mycobacterium dioxanotrophicus]|jgi:hypothetical protein|uniref:Minor tail protein n=1 Tax=Mycobacterium dioxanotrophicus TaxID=482462 RepID=A0A1Y0BZ31_9MYCO|nr:hypothetical protein [Mycobacterium dioxanotrophicus]ART68211.1 hypothetical protein BTO20_06095 [Mycobacterium dioxanotrophicus]
MSGVATLQRPARTDQEWARQISRRLDVLENPRSLRVSDWVINSVDGKLIATRPGQSVNLDNPTGPVSVDLGSLRGFTSTDREEVVNEAKTSAWQELYEKLTGQLNPVDALKSLSDFFRIELGGPISADRIPLIPLTHIRDINRNLILDGGFDTGDTLLGLPDWAHDDTDGRSQPGCAVTTADGTSHVIYSNDIQVAKDDKLNLSVAVKWVGLTALAGSDAIRLNVAAYDASGVMIGGAPTMVASVASPSGNSGGTNGWGTTISGTYTVPDTAVLVTVELTVMASATAGTVKFDDAEARKTGSFLQMYVKDLPADLQSLFGWIEATVNAGLGALGIPALGSLADKLLDFQDGLSDLQDAAEDAFANAQNALGALSDKLGIGDWNNWLSGQWDTLRNALANNPASVLGSLPQSLIAGLTNKIQFLTSGGLFDVTKLSTANGTAPQSIITNLPSDLGSLQTTLNQIGDIFNNNVVTPVNSIVQSVKDWWNQWFGGGSSNAIPLSQKGSANGVAPLNSSSKVPTSYLETNVNNGVAGLNGSGKVATSLLVTDTASNVPTLDTNALLRRTQLPVSAPKVVSMTSAGGAVGTINLNTTEQLNLSVPVGTSIGWQFSGSPLDGQSLLIRIKDTGTAVPLGWATIGGGASWFRPIGVTLPTTTVAGKWLYVGCKWNAADSVLDVIAVGQEV